MNLKNIFTIDLKRHPKYVNVQATVAGNKKARSRRKNLFRLAKLRLASHPDTALRTLEKLAKKESVEVLERVAENPQTSANILDELASHDHPDVRSAVAENENTSGETIESLAGDESVDVRFTLAENPRTPLEILHTLAEDNNPYVAERAKLTIRNLDS